MSVRYKVADVETAGFKGPDANGSGVVEVAWLEIDESFNVLAQRSSLINPGRAIEEGASDTHGIYDADVAYAPTLETFYKNNWGSDPTVLIAHNKNFDLKFLAPQIQLLVGSLCTLNAARQYLPKAPNHKLATLAAHLNLETGTAHRALGDVWTTYGLLKFLCALTSRTLPELVKLDEKPKVLTEMPFGEHKGKSFNDLPVSYLDWILRIDDMPSDIKMSARVARDLK